jgi:hypothetical protein
MENAIVNTLKLNQVQTFLFGEGDSLRQLRLALNSRFSCLNLPSAEIIGMHHHA